jgi:hypothetical protein
MREDRGAARQECGQGRVSITSRTATWPSCATSEGRDTHMLKQPGHFTSMKKELGDCTRRFSLWRFSSSSRGGCSRSISPIEMPACESRERASGISAKSVKDVHAGNRSREPSNCCLCAAATAVPLPTALAQPIDGTTTSSVQTTDDYCRARGAGHPSAPRTMMSEEEKRRAGGCVERGIVFIPKIHRSLEVLRGG